MSTPRIRNVYKYREGRNGSEHKNQKPQGWRHSSTFRHLFGLPFTASLPLSLSVLYRTMKICFLCLPPKKIFPLFESLVWVFLSDFSADFRIRRQRRITGNWTVQLRAAKRPTNRLLADKTSWRAEQLESFPSLRIRYMQHRRAITYTQRLTHSIARALSGRAKNWVTFRVTSAEWFMSIICKPSRAEWMTVCALKWAVNRGIR